MKRILGLLVILLSAVPLLGQSQTIVKAPFEQAYNFTASGSGPCWSLPDGIGYHTIRWYELSAISAGTVKLQGSMSSDCSSPSDIITAQAITSSGTVNGTSAQWRYVQLVVASHAGGGLRVFYAGDKAASALGAAVTVTSGNIAVTNAGTFAVQCDSGCSGGTTDSDDGSIAAAQSTGISLGLNQYYNGSAWVRMLGNATDGLLVNLGANNDVTVTSGTIDTITNTVTVQGTITANLSATDNAVLDDIADGIEVTCPTCPTGSGTQYTEGDVDATFTGNVLLMEVAGNTAQPIQGTVADGLLVNLGSNNDVDTELPAAAALADNTSNPTVPGVAAFLMCYDGSTWDRCPSSAGGAGTIDSNTTRVVIASDDDVSDAATLFEANLVAHDAADAGSPLKIGMRAVTSVSAQTPVAANDRTDALSGTDGVQIMRLNSASADRVIDRAVITDGSSTEVIAAQGAGISFCMTDITVSNSSATNVTVDIRDGAAGGVFWTFPAAADMGGATHHFSTPVCTSFNTELAADPSAAASSITVSIAGFKSKI